MRAHIPGSLAVIESLEPRLAPAGVILLSTAGGVLTVTGDAEGNSIRITDVPGSGEWTIAAPLAGTTYVLNGVTQANVPFNIPSLDGIKANLGDGDDQLELLPSNGASGMMLNSLTITGGKGIDKLMLGNAGGQALQVQGATTIDSGDGDDIVFVGGSAVFEGVTNFKLGSGKDILFFLSGAEHTLLKGLKVDLGAGEKSLFIASSEFNVSGGAFSVVGGGMAEVAQQIAINPTSGSFHGAASIAITAGDLTLDLSSAGKALRFGSTLSIATGAGDDHVTLGGTVETSRAVTVDLKDGGDSFTLDNNSQAYLGSLTVKADAGNDFINLNPTAILTTLGAFNADLGSGAINSFQVLGTSNMTVGGNLTVLGGAGLDAVFFGGAARIVGAVSVDVKDGDNQITLGSSLTVGSLALKGGIGDDTISVGQNSLLQSSGLFAMTLGAGTNVINGAANAAVVVGSLSYTGGAGDDTLSFAGGVFSSLGATTWNPGAGANTLAIEPTAYTFLGGAVKINGGSGTDSISLKGPDVRVVGALSFALGDGTNEAEIESPLMNLGSSLTYTGAAGADSFSIGAGKLYVAGAISLKPGNGTNEVTFGATSGSVGSVSYTGGTGLDAFQMGADNLTTRITVAGGLTVMGSSGSNSLSLYSTAVQGATVFKSTSSTSHLDGVFFLDSSFNGPATISTGSGTSNILVNDSVFRGLVNINTGDGNDVIRLDTANNTAALNHWFGKLTINAGAGADAFHLGANPVDPAKGNAFYKGIVLDGGTGVDSVAVDSGNTYVVPLVANNL